MKRIFALAGFALALSPVQAQQAPAEAEAEAGAADAAELAPLTVTADPFADRSPVESTQPAEVLGHEALERARAQTLGESLDGLPGVRSADFGAGSSRPVIRGQGGPRVRVLDGGASVADASTISPDHNVAVEPFRAQQIEVLKGPATLLYGSGAIGGVVNVVSDLLPQQPLTRMTGSIGVQAGSVDEARSGYGHVEGGNGRVAFHLDVLRRETEDYDIPGRAEAEHTEETHSEGEGEGEHAQGEEHEDEARGTVPNSFTETESLAGGLSWTFDGGYVGVGATLYDTIYGVPGHGHGEEEHGHAEEPAPLALPGPLRRKSEGEEEEGVFIDLRQRHYELRAGRTAPWGGFDRMRGSIVVSEYEHAEIEPAGEEPAGGGQGAAEPEAGTVFSNDAVELRAELTHRRIAGWQGVFGLQAQQQEFAAIGEEAFVPPVDTQAVGLFVVEEREFAVGRLSLGGRVETVRHEASGENPDRDFDLFSASLGWHQELGASHHMNVNLSHAQRAPDVLELYADGPHLATLTIENGNPDLDVERSWNIDLGHAGQRGDWFYGADVYYTLYQDYIFAEEQPHEEEAQAEGEMHAHEDDELTPIAYVQEDARFYGGELEFGYRLNARHSLRLFADAVRAERDGGALLPRIPADRVGMAFDGASGRWGYALRVAAVQEQERATPSEGETEGYTLLGADLEYTLPLGESDLVLALRGRNLLDEEARNHVSFLKDEAPLPGANLRAELEWRF